MAVLTCRELVELVTDFLERALPEHVHRDVVAHLSDCSECLRYVAQLQLTARTLGQLPAEELSDDTLAELVEAFRTRPIPVSDEGSGSGSGSL